MPARARARPRAQAAIALAAALALSGCGLGSAASPTETIKVIVQRPPTVSMTLQLPGASVSTASTLHLATTDPTPIVRGSVRPAGATVYVRTPGGGLSTVAPRRNGRFTVRTELTPGRNAFQFIAYQLGSLSRTARVAITWRASGEQATAAKAPPNVQTDVVPAVSSGIVTVSSASDVPLDQIKAPAPPASGGDGKWMNGFELTEYYPALEAWAAGRPVQATGLTGLHRIDWLYGAHGLSMEGEGIGLDGQWYHIAGLGAGGWVTQSGDSDARFGDGANAPYWRTGGFWRTAGGTLTFPLDDGSWSAGVGVKYVRPPAGISFAPGQSKPLTYLRSVAVDPSVIPLGSYIYIPAYTQVNGGWFQAQDTGGAIVGRHIDVFRPPPASPSDEGNFATGQQVYVIAPGRPLP